jgi:hypothetical protein
MVERQYRRPNTTVGVLTVPLKGTGYSFIALRTVTQYLWPDAMETVLKGPLKGSLDSRAYDVTLRIATYCP